MKLTRVDAQALLNHDPYLRVEKLQAYSNPQQAIWLAMHQDYSPRAVVDQLEKCPLESEAGRAIVKHLLSSDRGHYGCYSADTEVLTSEGWVAWPDISQEHELAAVDIHSGATHFERPKAVQEFEVKQGDLLYEATSQRINFAVTLDHRMVISHRSQHGWSNWCFAPAASVIGRAVRYRLAGVLVDEDREIPAEVPEGVNLINLFKLAGFFFGDGLRTHGKKPNCLRFRLRRGRKIRYLKSLGFSVADKAGDRYTVSCGRVASWINNHFSSSSSKRLPRFITRLPLPLLKALLDGLKNSDGTIRRNTWALDSTEKEALDLLQAACHLNNIPTSLVLNNPNEGENHTNHAPCWRLRFSGYGEYARFEAAQNGRTKGIETLKKYEGRVYCATVSTGALIVRRNNKPIVCGNCLEHAQITVNACSYPHSVIQQARTHRIGVSFDVQSFRYTGANIANFWNQYGYKPEDEQLEAIEKLIYFRPPGIYSDRTGQAYQYTEAQIVEDKHLALEAIHLYAHKFNTHNYSEEHARGMLPFDYRQHFVVSLNARSLMHFLDLRAKKDAQLEIQALCHQLMEVFERWAPELANWYRTTRWTKARLAP
ncbi:FAD-dependent thymidylate synthase [Synechococcus elongatus IITB4]|uniref:FAD-dependent thymidylate synthase n=1 Tax=Synechococcus elongatus TaxID=32046 RepID=UPI0030CDB04D